MTTQPEPDWLSPQEQLAWRAYLRASRQLEVALDRDLQVHGLSLAEYEIISMVSEAPERRLRMSALADMVVQSRSRMTHTAKRLEARGWVERVPVLDDRRGVDLVLTDEGWEALDKASRVHIEGVREHLVSALSPEEFMALGEAMRRVSEGLGTPPGGPKAGLWAPA
ncbi:MarR family winged helix-turn-helix transcriptional regulator [Luteipulveratus mongoliensis]|uniref:Transcriptional regulator n=1 Tax=Luteipulveratus mongoliensis TaxID=571913 RepID=A0A0K1JN25_9MICO|nr:MarR family transcriptional regulator [Luteipulveratus mongoliensis]AKU17988.1 transcriptional regulator [Luteipulveratus mongoliensis]